MSTRIVRTRHAGAVLDRILEQPALVQAVQELEPAVLRRLIRHVGLEDCGELVALASRAQIEQVFDEDLWRAAPGQDARFDAKRFALWLDVLVEQGVGLATDKLCELDEDLLTLALSRLIFVIDIESLAVRMSQRQGDDALEQLEKQLESTLHHELEHYRVIARDARAFESVLAVLLELDTRDYETLARMLERCCAISTDYIEDHGGLYQVLSAAQTAEEDAADLREQRRERAGYVTPSSAVAFLKLARDTPLAELAASDEHDPLTKAHFRSVERAPRAPRARSTEHDRLLRVLREAKVLAPEAKALPRNASGTPLRRALAALADAQPALHAERMLELAYLANVLLAAQGIRPVEAAERALETCERGLAYVLREPAALDQTIAATDLIKLFRIGFQLQLRK